MPHSKTPGGQGPSDKYLKQQAQSTLTPFAFSVQRNALSLTVT